MALINVASITNVVKSVVPRCSARGSSYCLLTPTDVSDRFQRQSSLRELCVSRSVIPSSYTMDFSTLNARNPVLQCYAFYSSILILKMMGMSLLTAMQRFRKKAFISPEDAAAFKGEVKNEDPDVERVRRAHLNDLENIPIFLITGFIFVLIDPDVVVALMLFRLYTLARLIHTLVYAIFVVRQPTRAIAFGVGQLINFIMIIMIIIKFHQL